MQIQVPSQTNKPTFISSSDSTVNNNSREKTPPRSLEARRAIEDYFENKRLSYLIGDDYWGDD